MPRQFGGVPEDPLLISTGQAAKLIGCSPQTVRNFQGSGFISAVVSPTSEDRNNYRFDLAEVEELAKRWGRGRPGGVPEAAPWSFKRHKVLLPGNYSYDISIELWEV